MSERFRGGRCSVRRCNAWVGFRVRLAQRELEYSMKTDEFEIPPMRCRARRSRAVFKISRAFTRHAGKFAAADLEGFSHSAAADGKMRPHAHARISIECAMSSQRFQNAHARIWIECAMSSQ